MKLEFQSFPTKYLTSYSTLLQKLLFFFLQLIFQPSCIIYEFSLLCSGLLPRVGSASLPSPPVLQPKRLLAKLLLLN